MVVFHQKAVSRNYKVVLGISAIKNQMLNRKMGKGWEQVGHKKSSTSLITEMQIRTTPRYHLF